MRIEFAAPLSRAINTMKRILFKPFDLALWLGMGLSAFLANLAEGEGGGRSWMKDRHDWHDARDIFEWPYQIWDWIVDHPGWTMLIIFGALCLIGLVILLTWLSSRGKLMFVHNVVTGTGQVVKPWHEYRREGNSLTIWRLVFGLAAMAVIGMLIFQVVLSSGVSHHLDFMNSSSVLTLIGYGLLLLAVIFIIAAVSALLNDFIVPLMVKERLTTTEAWHRFLPLLKTHGSAFFLYLLFVFVLKIAVAAVVIAAGLATCCVGFLFLIIPYVSSVILLPVSVSFRAFSLTFLAQFGPEFDLFSGQPQIPEAS